MGEGGDGGGGLGGTMAHTYDKGNTYVIMFYIRLSNQETEVVNTYDFTWTDVRQCLNAQQTGCVVADDTFEGKPMWVNVTAAQTTQPLAAASQFMVPAIFAEGAAVGPRCLVYKCNPALTGSPPEWNYTWPKLIQDLDDNWLGNNTGRMLFRMEQDTRGGVAEQLYVCKMGIKQVYRKGRGPEAVLAFGATNAVAVQKAKIKHMKELMMPITQ